MKGEKTVIDEPAPVYVNCTFVTDRDLLWKIWVYLRDPKARIIPLKPVDKEIS